MFRCLGMKFNGCIDMHDLRERKKEKNKNPTQICGEICCISVHRFEWVWETKKYISYRTLMGFEL